MHPKGGPFASQSVMMFLIASMVPSTVKIGRKTNRKMPQSRSSDVRTRLPRIYEPRRKKKALVTVVMRHRVRVRGG